MHASLTVLQDGLGLVESPRWHDGRLWFADWFTGRVLAVDPVTGEGGVVLSDEPTFPCSIDWRDGELLVVRGREHRIASVSGETIADLSPLSTTPWNEIVVDGRRNTYVNCTGFEFPGGDFAPGFIALVRPDGSVSVVAEDLAFPNGMAVTADGTTLLVAESYKNCLTAFTIGDDGSLSDRRVWADLGGGNAPDGICLDASGACWVATVPGQRCIRVAEGGDVLSTVAIDRGAFACMLGGADGTTLFITAARWGEAGVDGGQVLATEVSVPGAGWPAR